MFNKILRFRYVFLISVVFTLLNSLVFMVGGVIESIHGYTILLQHGIGEEHRPGIYLMKSLDMFLVSMVFLIFGLGIMRLFTHYHEDEKNLPSWLKIESFKELKVLLWETILVTLVVFTLTSIVANEKEMQWSALILPSIILTLTASLFLMTRK